MDAKGPLEARYRVAKRADWNNLADTKVDFPHTDPVGSCIVFNIGGNKYRLITKIHYRRKKVYIRFALTHKEYDKGRWKNDCGC